jgi:hypothetical protein
MRFALPVTLLPLLLAWGAGPAWCQVGAAILPGPAAWTPAGSLASPGGWTTSAAAMNARTNWSTSGMFTPPAPWHVVTDLKPLSLGSIPPGSRSSGPGQVASPKPGIAP